VFVTHDIDEAIRLGDRIAVMREGGHLEQYADPTTLLSKPETPYVAEFIGAERTLRRLAVAAVPAEGLVSWPVVAPTDSLAESAAAMDAVEAAWAVVADDASVHGWLSRAEIQGDATAADRLEAAKPVEVGASLESALATILAGNAPGAIVTRNGRYLGVLEATELVTAARAR
jgi:osmoprotectant transport system ATP-binding protein